MTLGLNLGTNFYLFFVNITFSIMVGTHTYGFEFVHVGRCLFQIGQFVFHFLYGTGEMIQIGVSDVTQQNVSSSSISYIYYI